MGIFRRIGDWLTEKSERFIRGESDGTGGYYATREAEQAYGGMGMDQEPVQDGLEGEEAPRRQPLDPFGHGEGEYGGRVPYHSRYDLEREREAHLERPVMIHAQLLDLDQLDKVKELGVVPSFFAAHVYHWGDVHVKNFGAERAARISPAGAALERDIPFTFHQDTPVLPPDMLETVWCGVNRLTRSGAVLGPEQKIPVVEALAAVTIRAAWQYFEEGEKGSLREGKRADLVLLERDPLTADPMSLRDIPVLATWKDGRLIYRREG